MASSQSLTSSFSFRRTSIVNLPPQPPPNSHVPIRRRLHFPTCGLKRSPKRLKYNSQSLLSKKGEKMVYVEMDPSGTDTWRLEPVVELIRDGAVGVIPTDTVKKGEKMVYVEMDPWGTDTWRLEPVVELIRGGAVGVIPIDTMYAIVCDLKNNSSIERLRRIKDMEHSKPLSILCRSFRDIDTYTLGFPRGNAQGQTNIFRAVKHCFPGPYTFILPASKELPKQCTKYGSTAKFAARKHVGVRMPDDVICQAILRNLDAPLICTSVKWPDKDLWMLDPVIIADIYEPEGLDFIVDGGVRRADPSTVVDMTGSTPTIIRQGKGIKLDWMVVKSEDSASQDELPLA